MQAHGSSSSIPPTRTSTYGVGLFDIQLRFLEVDATLAGLHRLPVEAHSGRALSELLPDLAPKIEPILRQVLADGEPVSGVELRGALPAGSSCHWLASYYPVRTRAGKVLAIECEISDLAQPAAAAEPVAPGEAGQAGRLLAATALRHGRQPVEYAEAVLNTVFGATQLGLAFVDRDFRFILVNERLAALNGRPVAEHLGRTPRELFPMFAPIWETYWHWVLSSGEPVLNWALDGHMDGVLHHALVNYYPVRDHNGEIYGILLLISDVTEQKLTEASLRRLYREAAESARIAREERALSEALVAAAPVGFAVIDHDLVVQRMNPPIAEAAGLVPQIYRRYDRQMRMQFQAARLAAISDSEEKVPSGPHLREVLPAMAEVVMPFVGQVLGGGAPILNHEYRFGERIWRLNVYPVLTTDGQMLGAGLIATEITTLQRLLNEATVAQGAAELALRSRDELFAVISHDLRHPLTAILGHIDLLKRWIEQPADYYPKLVRGLDVVREAALQLNFQIDELLDLARINAGKPLTLDRTLADIGTITSQAVVTAQMSSSSHVLEVELPEGALLCLCDPLRLRRALLNLLTNAINYSPSSSTIYVTVASVQDSTGLWATVVVKDEGIGIPAVDLPRIFERFHRGTNVGPDRRGIGLGLAGAYALVSQHGGSLSVSSVEGEGSIFTVVIPALRQGRQLDESG